MASGPIREYTFISVSPVAPTTAEDACRDATTLTVVAVVTLVACGPPKLPEVLEVGTTLATTWWTVGIAATVAIEVGKVAMIVAPEEEDEADRRVDGEDRVDCTTVVEVVAEAAVPILVGDAETVVGMVVPARVLSC